MKTPITDAFVLDNEFMPKTCDCLNLASKLELDRAALLEALCEIHIVSHSCSIEGAIASKALASARANFPD